jgi:trans-L-3-hydroxyproline dehydratase
MCGHGVIALGRYAVDYNVVKPVNPETVIKIQCPCGLVTAHVEYDAMTGKSGQARFESVPAFAFTVDQTIQVGEMHACMHFKDYIYIQL